MENQLDAAVQQLGLMLAVRKDAFDAVREAAKTHEGLYISSGIASRLISIMDAAKVVLDIELALPAAPAISIESGAGENPLAVVHEVLNDWLDENEAADFDENDIASLFAMLGTAGYSIVPNATLAGAPAGGGVPQNEAGLTAWVLLDEERQVVGLYATESAADNAVEPDREAKVYPGEAKYYSAFEMPIEGGAALLLPTRQEAGPALLSIEGIRNLVEQAKVYRTDACKSILRNEHMNELDAHSLPSDRQIDAVLVDFINYVALRRGMDLALYACDLYPVAPTDAA